jgi:uncharacterized protein (TIGR02145 family)
MITKNWILICSLIVIGLVLILTNSCKKGEDSNVKITDVDGNVYTSVTIGTQVWMVENLKVTHYRNGDVIPNVQVDALWYNLLSGAYVDYGNIPSNGEIYGKLYNWYAVSDSRKLAPIGWHVATDAEWLALRNFLGGESIAGGKIKDPAHWEGSNLVATNESGFTALPAGRHNTPLSGLPSLGWYGYWWSSTEYSTSDGWYWSVNLWDNGLWQYYSTKNCGFSVRCLKDN